MNTKITLFLDMDNTVAHFSNGKLDDPRALKESKKQGFFASLRPVQMAWIYNILAIFIDVRVISAAENTPWCIPEKEWWCRKYLPLVPRKNLIFVPIGTDKAAKAVEILNRPLQSTDFLVDDYGRNLAEWQVAGGTPVKKSYSTKDREIPTIHSHVEIISVLKKAIY